MSNKQKYKPLPSLNSHSEAEKFVNTGDLSEYDFSGFTPMKFEFEKKSKRVQLRMQESLKL